MSLERAREMYPICATITTERDVFMNKNATVRARIESEIKEEAESILGELGISTTSAISMFYRQVILRKGLPFDVAILNPTTRRTFETTDAGRDIIVCTDAEDMFAKLGI